MELSEADYRRIAHCFPKPRGTLTYGNLQTLNAILYIAENGTKWRRLPERFGNWHTIYTRMRGWAKAGVLARVFEALQQEQIIRIKVERATCERSLAKETPDSAGTLEKSCESPSEISMDDSRPRLIWLPTTSGQHYASPSPPKARNP